MNRLLTRDEELFRSRFHEAASFLQAAHNRYECYCLALDSTRTPWQAQRLTELLGKAPSCREPWFVVQLRGDAGKNGIENYLLEAGL